MKRSNKNFKGIAAGVLALALIFTGTLAWRDTTQHKTNRFGEIDDKEYNVVLTEELENDRTDFVSGEQIRKSVFVRNGSKDDQEDFDYGSVVVRLQFREWLGLNDAPIELTDDRFMIDESGNFIAYPNTTQGKEDLKFVLEDLLHYTEVQADALLADIGAGKRLQVHKNYFDIEEKIYIKTQQNDPNGIYGKFIATGYGPDGKFVSVVGGETVDLNGVMPGDDELHPIKDNQSQLIPEDRWTPRTWADDLLTSDKSDYGKNKVAEYVNLHMSNVITLKEFKEAAAAYDVDQYIDETWILDTESDEGWMYWFGGLDHDNTGIFQTPYATKEALESVGATDMFNDIANHHQVENPVKYKYFLHINMDTVSVEKFAQQKSGWEDDMDPEIARQLGFLIVDKYDLYY